VVVSYLKCLCKPLKVEHAMMRNGRLTLRFAQNADIDPMKLMQALSATPQLMLSATQPPALLMRDPGETEVSLHAAIPLLESIINDL